MIITNPLPQYHDVNGNPLSNGYLRYYEPNTTDPKDIFYDENLTISAPNPITLNSAGRTTQAIYTTYPYKVVAFDEDNEEQWSVEYVDLGLEGSGGLNYNVSSIAALRNITGQSAGDIAYVSGYYEAGDQGGGTFVWRTDLPNDDNNGTVIRPVGAPALGTWIRQVDDYLTPLMFGASYSDSTKDSSGAFTLCGIEANSGLVQRDIYIPSGRYQVNGGFAMNGGFELILGDNVEFYTNDVPSTPYVVELNCTRLSGGKSAQIVDYDKVRLHISALKESTVYLEWYGDKASNLDPDILNYAFANSSNNLDYVVTTEWNLGDDVSAANKNIRFQVLGEFNFASGSFNVNELKNERTDGAPCVTGIFGTGNGAARKYDSNVFLYTDNTSNNASVLGEVQDFITSRNGNDAVLNWVKGDYTITGSTFDNGSKERTHYTFESGCTITADDRFDVPSHTNVPYIAFNRSMAGYVHFYEDIDIRMFGVVAWNGSGSTLPTFIDNNADALLLAVKSADLSITRADNNGGTPYLVGGNQEYLFKGGLTYTSSSPSSAIPARIKDVEFSFATGFSSTFGFLVTNIPLRIESSTFFFPVAQSDDATSGISVINTSSFLEVIDSKITGLEAATTNMGTLAGLPIRELRNSECKLNVLCTDPSDVVIEGNTITQLTFTATSSNYTASRVSVVNNKFYATTSKDVGIFVTTSGGGNIFDQLHSNCEVYRNSFNNDGTGSVSIKATRFVFRQPLNPSVSGNNWSANITLPGEMIFQQSP